MASGEYELIALNSSSSTTVVIKKQSTTSIKIPISKRRSPMDSLDGRTHTTVITPVQSSSERSHRNPLDALGGNFESNKVRKPVVVTIKKPVKSPKVVQKRAAVVKKTIHKTPKKLVASIKPLKKSTKINKPKIHHRTPVVHNRTSGTKTMYLTFDDGPLKGTRNVLRATREEGIEATMFFVGEHIRNNTALFNKALSMPNLQISNHTYSHANNKYEEFYNNKELVLKDIDKAQKLIGGPKYLRLCGRNVWRLPSVKRDDFAIRDAQRQREVTDYNEVEAKGYQIYGWDIEWEFDHATKLPLLSADEMADKIEHRYNRGYTAKKGKMILLAHDYMFKGEEGRYRLKEFISILKSRGWKFATIGNYTKQTPDVFVKLKKRAQPKKIVKTKESKIVQFPKDQITVTSVNKSGKIPVQKKKITLTTQLNDAIIEFKPSQVRRLIRRGADVNAIDQSGHISLNTAVRANNMTIVKILVRQGALVNNRDAKGASPILMAKRYNRLAIGSYLINQLNIQTGQSRLALQEKVNPLKH